MHAFGYTSHDPHIFQLSTALSANMSNVRESCESLRFYYKQLYKKEFKFEMLYVVFLVTSDFVVFASFSFFNSYLLFLSSLAIVNIN